MAMLHPDDQNFYKTCPVSIPQITALFASHLPTDRVTSVSSPDSITGEYHKIYFVELESGNQAVLRVARPYIPHIKVENEVAVLTYLTRHCPTVPVPRVWFWSADAEATDNTLGFEYIVMDWIKARNIDSHWRTLDEDTINDLFDQVAEHWLTLRDVSMGSSVGGLKFGRTSGGMIDETIIEAGPVVEETFWQTPDIRRYWHDIGLTDETFATLNISGPYGDYRRYVQAHLSRYSHAISIHPSLKFARSILPRVAQLVQNLDDESFAYTRATVAVKVFFGHRDTHLGNFLFEGNKIISVIDWEFSGLWPSFSTNPTPPVVWVDKIHPPTHSDREHRPVLEIWQPRLEAIVNSRAPGALKDLEIPPDVKPVFSTWNWMRCICEVSPRNKRLELAQGSWFDNLDSSLKELGL